MSDDDDFLASFGQKSAYLVRLKSDQEFPREFVGIFVADDLEELGMFVDECCAVEMCEYLELPSGGIYQNGRASVVPHSTDDEEPRFFEGATLCGTWVDAFLIDKGDRGWAPLAPSRGANDRA